MRRILCLGVLALCAAMAPMAAQTAPPGIWHNAFTGDIATVEHVLRQDPAFLDCPDPRYSATPLQWASAGGQVATAAMLLAWGAQVDATNRAGMTALHNAAIIGSPALVDVLLATGADPHLRDGAGMTAADHARNRGQAAIAERLAEAAAPTPQNRLLQAARTGEPAAVLALLDREPALANHLALLDQTPLRWALAQGATQAANRLRRAVAETPAALQQAHAPEGALWLEHLEPLDHLGNTVRPADRMSLDHLWRLGGKTYAHGLWSHDRDSHYTVLVHGQATRLSLMVGLMDANGEHGRLRFVVMADARRVADTGFMHGGQPPKLLMADVAGAERLSVRVDTGGDGNWANAALGGVLLEVTANEALHAAAVSGRTSELDQLLKVTAAPLDRADRLFGVSAFWAACLAGQPETATLLAEHGAVTDTTDALGNTVLHHAAATAKAAAIVAATRAGCDPCLKNHAGQTAHQLAATRGDAACVAALTEAELWRQPQAALAPAEDFTLDDLDGHAVTLSALRGRTVVLFFFSPMGWNKGFEYTWLDYAQTLADSPTAKQGKLVVLAATPERPDVARAFLKEQGYTFRVVLDPSDTIRRQLGLYGLPAVVIDGEGQIAWQRRLWQRNRIEDSGLFLAVRQVLSGAVRYRSGAAPTAGAGQVEEVLFDFERDDQGWAQSGDCWSDRPSDDALYPSLVKGYTGRRFLSTLAPAGWRTTGLARSPAFTITRPFLHSLVGGGDLPDHASVSLVIDGCAVRRATGTNTAELRPVVWDVRHFVGREAYLEVVDTGHDEPRDFLLLDDVVLSDSPQPPARYADGFDPDDPTDAAAVADQAPTFIQQFRAGKVHQDAMPGRTYRLEWQAPVQWEADRATWLLYALTCPQDHVAQTVRRLGCRIVGPAGYFPCQVVPTPAPLYPQAFCAWIPARALPQREATVQYSCDLTPHILDLVAGPPPVPPQDLSADTRASLTAPVKPFYDYTEPAVAQFLDEHRLRRWPTETDAAFLFRAYRFLQRSFVYGNVRWAGHPVTTADAGPLLGSLEARMADCGLVHPLAMILRANGIPAAGGQGGWVPEDGPMGAHVRLLTYLRDVGWFWLDVGPDVVGPHGWLQPGSRIDDNFAQFHFEDPAGWDSQLVAPGPGTVLRARADNWPLCRLVKRPELVPLSPCADTQRATWRGMTRQPPAGWEQPAFDDHAWITGLSGFGSKGLSNAAVGSDWGTSDLWLRREMTINAGDVSAPRLRVRHESDCEIYVNGQLAARLSGGRGDYALVPLSTEARRVLRPGRVVLGVHCHDPEPSRFIDVGLVDVRP